MRYLIKNRATGKTQWVDSDGWKLLTDKGYAKLFIVVETDDAPSSMPHPRPLTKKIALPEPVEITDKRRKAKTEATPKPVTNQGE